MTIYVIINPNQSYPFEQDIKEELEKSHRLEKFSLWQQSNNSKSFFCKKERLYTHLSMKYTRPCITKSHANCFILVYNIYQV